jgi:hypothetical protein
MAVDKMAMDLYCFRLFGSQTLERRFGDQTAGAANPAVLLIFQKQAPND